jgi:hypothetical protein
VIQSRNRNSSPSVTMKFFRIATQRVRNGAHRKNRDCTTGTIQAQNLQTLTGRSYEIQYRLHLIDGCQAGTGLTIEP